MKQSVHPIQAVAARTGLSAHVIRIWEKRYQAVAPQRTETNRRFYSDDDVERLSLLRDLTRHGQSIGYVAKLPTDQLRALAAPSNTMRAARADDAGGRGSGSAGTLLAEGIASVGALDGRAFAETLQRATVALGTQGMLQRFAAPLAQTLGDLWRDGQLTAAHEHFASAALRTYLGQSAQAYATSGREPVLIVATPAGQLHEIGALLVAALAANLGWRVIYLGANLPAAEIAGPAAEHHARAVALSLVYPEDDARLESELIRLRELLPASISILAGGRALPGYRLALQRIGARTSADLNELGTLLDELRGSGPAKVPSSAVAS